MITKEQRIKDFLTLKLKDAKNDVLQIKALIKEVGVVKVADLDNLLSILKVTEDRVAYLETLINS